VGRFVGKSVFVTGAASGLGEASAKLFAVEGGKVLCGDLNFEQAQIVAGNIVAAGGVAEAIRLDVTDAPSVDAAVRRVEELWGRLDATVHSAGIAGAGSACDLDQVTWDRIISVNLTGAWHVSKASIDSMRKSKGGSLVLIASISGLLGMPGIAAYSAAKGGVVALTRQMAVDYAPHGIRVNAICPGTIPTPLVMESYKRQGYLDSDQGEDQLQKMTSRYPLGRYGRPEEVAELALYMASENSAFMTGTAVPIDGGISASGWQVGQ
jgi:NAD(P)-dependent dehydrogenase (short-subunit alcohol dehydrogenase family)